MAVKAQGFLSTIAVLRDSRTPLVWRVAALFGVLLALQALGLAILGTNRAGLGWVLFLLLLASLIPLGGAINAARRARGVAALFWCLFALDMAVVLFPTVIQFFDTVFDRTTFPDSTRALLYCLFGAPILMMLFLPDAYARARMRAEIFLDLLQISIVVALVYSVFFFLPAQRMLPAEALRHDVTVSDGQCVILLLAALVRLKFAQLPGMRDLVLRLAAFVFVCTVTTFIGDWIDLQHNLKASTWFNIGWTVPQVAAGLLVVSWTPPPDSSSVPVRAKFSALLATNLILVAMLSCVHSLSELWRRVHGEWITNLAVAGSLVALTLRLSLTQFRQEKEIGERLAAQLQLTSANTRVGRLLEDAREQTTELAQISDLGSLLQACTSREEVFRLLPDRMRRLFPGTSGGVFVLSNSRNRVESAAEWGLHPASQIFRPEECWAFRRGRIHIHLGGVSAVRCTHFLDDSPSICIPLLASGEAIGILSLQHNHIAVYDPDRDLETMLQRRHKLAAAVAEHMALALANLALRDALRMQAVRDPLTGLYNRRYMQEFLDRELHSARRKRRPLAVMMLDLDHFKRFNDEYGHAAGDQALAAMGETLLRCVRADDVACRYGGEEFLLVLPECSLRQAATRADEIRKRLRDFPIPHSGSSGVVLTVSVGVAAFDETTDRVDLLLKFADDALYQAKQQGRDRVVAATPASIPAAAEQPEPSLNPA